MANDLTKKPWIVDTASATPITTTEVVIHKIVCVGPSNTAGDQAVVQDGSGKEIAHFYATGANFKETSTFDGGGSIWASSRFTGLIVPTLTSGMKLYIHLA